MNAYKGLQYLVYINSANLTFYQVTSGYFSIPWITMPPKPPTKPTSFAPSYQPSTHMWLKISNFINIFMIALLTRFTCWFLVGHNFPWISHGPEWFRPSEKIASLNNKLPWKLETMLFLQGNVELHLPRDVPWY